MAPRSRKTKADDEAQNAEEPTVTDDTATDPAAVSTASPVGRHPRDTQHPALGSDGDAGVEVAERTVDIDTAAEPQSSANTRKVFTVPASEWDELDDDGKEAVHDRNRRAVRQFMLSQGLRAPAEAEVSFTGEERVKAGRGGRASLAAESVRLVYEVPATPVSTATEFEDVHMVVSPAPGTPTAEDQAKWEADAEGRVRRAHAVRDGR